MRTRAKDRIELPDGRVMTLGEALDAGILTLRLGVNAKTGKPSPGAWFGDVGWDVGMTLYKSRMGMKVFKCET